MNQLTRSLFLLAVFAIATLAVSAQDPRPVSDTAPQRPAMDDQVPQDRGQMFKLLNLSPMQLRQVRMANQQHKPVIDAAQQKLRDARKALDETIYADQVSDTDFQARLKALRDAQTEVTTIQSTHELAIRRILAPDQLTKFRVMRQRFEEARQNAARQKAAPGSRPMMKQGPPPGAKPE